MEAKPVTVQHADDDGVVIRVDDVLRFFRRYAGMILGLSLAGAAIGVCLTYFIPKQWEATG